MASFILWAHLELIPFTGLATLCTAVFTQTNPYHTHVLLHTGVSVPACRYTLGAVTPTHTLAGRDTVTGAISLKAPLKDKTKQNEKISGPSLVIIIIIDRLHVFFWWDTWNSESVKEHFNSDGVQLRLWWHWNAMLFSSVQQRISAGMV